MAENFIGEHHMNGRELNYPHHCFVSVATDGTKYVSVFEHNGRSCPTRNIIEHVDGKTEEWIPYYQNAIEYVQTSPTEYVQHNNNVIVQFTFPAYVQITIQAHPLNIS